MDENNVNLWIKNTSSTQISHISLIIYYDGDVDQEDDDDNGSDDYDKKEDDSVVDGFDIVFVG